MHRMNSIAGSIHNNKEESDKPRSLQKNACRTLPCPSPTIRAGLSIIAIYAGLRISVAAFQSLRRRNLHFLLFDVCDALDDVGITYWLDFGSLLGIHRDSDLIPYDNDIDLVVLDPDWPSLLPQLQQRLHPKYLVKVVTPSKESSGSSWVRVYCPLGMADLFSAYSTSQNKGNSPVSAPEDKENSLEDAKPGNGPKTGEVLEESSNGKEERMVFIDCGHGETMNIPRDFVVPPGSKQCRGRKIRLPHIVDKTLECRYGSEWMVPKYMDK